MQRAEMRIAKAAMENGLKRLGLVFKQNQQVQDGYMIIVRQESLIEQLQAKLADNEERFQNQNEKNELIF